MLTLLFLLAGIASIALSLFTMEYVVLFASVGVLFMVIGTGLPLIVHDEPAPHTVDETATQFDRVNALFELVAMRGFADETEHAVRNYVTSEQLSIVLKEDCLYILHTTTDSEVTSSDGERAEIGTFYATMSGAPGIYRSVFVARDGERVTLTYPSRKQMRDLPKEVFFADDSDMKMLQNALQTWDDISD